MKKVKITVLKTEFYPELAERYLTEGREAGPCPFQNVGDVFYYEGGAEKPEGLCQSAWDTMSPFVLALSHGGQGFYGGWMKDPRSVMLSCNDGFRPVSFLVEALEEDAD